MELQGNILELLVPETRTFKSPNTGEDVEYTSRVLLLDCSTYNHFGDPIENIVPITFTGRCAEGLVGGLSERLGGESDRNSERLVRGT